MGGREEGRTRGHTTSGNPSQTVRWGAAGTASAQTPGARHSSRHHALHRALCMHTSFNPHKNLVKGDTHISHMRKVRSQGYLPGKGAVNPGRVPSWAPGTGLTLGARIASPPGPRGICVTDGPQRWALLEVPHHQGQVSLHLHVSPPWSSDEPKGNSAHCLRLREGLGPRHVRLPGWPTCLGVCT